MPIEPEGIALQLINPNKMRSLLRSKGATLASGEQISYRHIWHIVEGTSFIRLRQYNNQITLTCKSKGVVGIDEIEIPLTGLESIHRFFRNKSVQAYLGSSAATIANRLNNLTQQQINWQHNLEFISQVIEHVIDGKYDLTQENMIERWNLTFAGIVLEVSLVKWPEAPAMIEVEGPEGTTMDVIYNAFESLGIPREGVYIDGVNTIYREATHREIDETNELRFQ